MTAKHPVTRLTFALVGASFLTLAACVPQPSTTPPPPQPTPKPAPRPTPPPPAPSNWMDAPRTLGNWSYTANRASYGNGTPVFTMSCERGSNRIVLSRSGSAAGTIPMRILTETATRLLDATAETGRVTASLSSRDPLLDAMAFSKGRFAVEIPGLSTLYLPSWVEVSRVIEDCR